MAEIDKKIEKLNARSDRQGVTDRFKSRIGRALRMLKELGPAGLFRLIREHGLAKTLDFVARNVRLLIVARFDRDFDRRHNVDTGGDIPLEYLEITSENAALGHQFISSSVKAFRRVIADVPFDLAPFSFIDIGCGKGRTLLLAAQYPFRKIIGVDFARDLIDLARQNFKNYRGPALQCRDLQAFCADAIETELLPVPLLIYFFNPFEARVFKTVCDKIIASLQQHPRPVVLVYIGSDMACFDEIQAIISGTQIFNEIPVTPLGYYLDSPRRLKSMIFRSRLELEGGSAQVL